MSSVVTDFQNYIRRRSYRPTVSGADQAEKAGQLQLLNRVLEKLEASEAQSARDAVALAAQSNGRLLKELEAANQELELARVRIGSLSRTAQAVHDLRAANQHLGAELKSANERLTRLSRRYDELEARVKLQGLKASPPEAEASPAPVLSDRVDKEIRRNRRQPHFPALVERAALLAAGYFKASPDDLTKEVGSGARLAFTIEYKMAKMSFLQALHSVTGVSLTRLVDDLELKDKCAATLWISRHRNLLDGRTFQEKHSRVCEELEAFALELEGMEVAAC